MQRISYEAQPVAQQGGRAVGAPGGTFLGAASC